MIAAPAILPTTPPTTTGVEVDEFCEPPPPPAAVELAADALDVARDPPPITPPVGIGVPSYDVVKVDELRESVEVEDPDELELDAIDVADAEELVEAIDELEKLGMAMLLELDITRPALASTPSLEESWTHRLLY